MHRAGETGCDDGARARTHVSASTWWCDDGTKRWALQRRRCSLIRADGFGNRSYLMVHLLTLATCRFTSTETTLLPFHPLHLQIDYTSIIHSESCSFPNMQVWFNRDTTTTELVTIFGTNLSWWFTFQPPISCSDSPCNLLVQLQQKQRFFLSFHLCIYRLKLHISYTANHVLSQSYKFNSDITTTEPILFDGSPFNPCNFLVRFPQKQRFFFFQYIYKLKMRSLYVQWITYFSKYTYVTQ